MKTNLRVTMQAEKTLRIDIYDVIGWNWFDGGITAQTISKQLKDAGDVDLIECHLNSPGGDAFEGIAIHNLFKEHQAKVVMIVDGVAASACSVLMMAGDRIIIPKNGLVMIHDPATFAYGGEDEMQKAIKRLSAVKDATVETYHAKSGKSKDQIAAWMKEETWFTGQEAVDAGLADATAKEVTLPKVEPAAGTQQMFRRAPPEQYSALVALCATASPPSPPQEQVSMADPVVPPVNPTAPVTPAVAPAVAQVSQADVDNKVSEVQLAERKRAGDIMAACTLAKKPEMAAAFIADGVSLSDVRGKLLETLCASNAPVGDAVNNNLVENKTDTSEDAPFKKEYAENKAGYLAVGMSEADYVSQRRIDEGLDQLVPKTAAK